MMETLKNEVRDLTGQLIEWRRDFHRHPEIAFHEERTSKTIRTFMETLGMPVSSYAKTGLRGELEGKPGGKTVAIRADMDALPITEEGDKDYISENPGATHSCGHDGHMAIAMGTAKILSNRKKQFRGKVVFLFQPAEELPPGGAEANDRGRCS